MFNASARRDRPAAWPISLLGIPFDNVTTAETVEHVAAMIESGQPHYLVTANVDFLIQAREDVELQRILIEAELVLCDGTPLLWASRGLGNPLPERVAGSDLVPQLMAAAAQKGHRVFLLGGGPDVAVQAAAKLQAQHPTLVTEVYSPPFSALLEMENAEILRRVTEAKPDILLVGFGCPKQEKWIAMHFRQLGVPVVIGVGATLDFLAERVKRAPMWMRKTGTEWLFRLAQEPRRLARRYANDLFHFLPALTRQWLQGRALRGKLIGKSTLTTAATRDWRQVRITGHFGTALLERENALFREVTADGRRHCMLDLASVLSLDSTALAVLTQWRGKLAAGGRELVLLEPSAPVRQVLDDAQLTSHFRIAVPAPHPTGANVGDEPPPSMVIPPYPGGHTVGWQGELTAANAEAVWAQTLRHLSQVGTPPRGTFIIDLSRLRFIDSTGAATMARVRHWAKQLRKDVRFLGSRPTVRNVLRLAKLGSLLETRR